MLVLNPSIHKCQPAVDVGIEDGAVRIHGLDPNRFHSAIKDFLKIIYPHEVIPALHCEDVETCVSARRGLRCLQEGRELWCLLKINCLSQIVHIIQVNWKNFFDANKDRHFRVLAIALQFSSQQGRHIL